MKKVSSLGGPRVLLPTSDVARWIDEFGDSPSPNTGLYGLACSIDSYCGVISPWDTPILVFGDEPADIYYLRDEYDGLFFRWIAADSIEQLTACAIAEANSHLWDETTSFNVIRREMTIMDSCTFVGDSASRIHLEMRTGSYTMRSRYAERAGAITVIHRLEFSKSD